MDDSWWYQALVLSAQVAVTAAIIRAIFALYDIGPRLLARWPRRIVHSIGGKAFVKRKPPPKGTSPLPTAGSASDKKAARIAALNDVISNASIAHAVKAAQAAMNAKTDAAAVVAMTNASHAPPVAQASINAHAPAGAGSPPQAMRKMMAANARHKILNSISAVASGRLNPTALKMEIDHALNCGDITQTEADDLKQQVTQAFAFFVQSMRSQAQPAAQPLSTGWVGTTGPLIGGGMAGAAATQSTKNPYLSASDLAEGLAKHLGISLDDVAKLPMKVYLMWLAYSAGKAEGDDPATLAQVDAQIREAAGLPPKPTAGSALEAAVFDVFTDAQGVRHCRVLPSVDIGGS